MQPPKPNSNNGTRRSHIQYNSNTETNTTNLAPGYFNATTTHTGTNTPTISNVTVTAINLASVNNSQILPLLKDGLRCHAKNNCYVTRMFVTSTPLHDDQLHISQSYVNLAIIENPDDKEKKQQQDDIFKSKAYTNERQQNYESLYKEKKPVEIDKIFDNSEHRRHLIIGTPGVGKTTLCQHLFYKCVQDDGLWSDKFEAVFWIPLRKLKSDVLPNNPAKLLAFVVCKYGLSGNDQDKISREIKKLGEFITNSDEKILWILDGYDEVILEANHEDSLVNVFIKN